MEVVRFTEKMNQNNNVLKEKDFEKYDVILPFTSMFGKRKRQFFYSELEKLHPCFSDEFAFDNTFKKLTRKGLFEKLFVIRKNKLAEYEGRRKFAGSGFLVEEGKKGKRLFVNPRIKFALWTVIGCLLVGISGSLSGALAGKAIKRQRNVQINVVRDSELSELHELTGPQEEDRQSAGVIVESTVSEAQFFETVAKAGGKIDRFEWKIDGFVQSLDASVSGVYPEAFSAHGFKLDTVVYKNSVPEIKVLFERKIHKANEDSISLQTSFLQKNETFAQGIRSRILESGGILQKEVVQTNQPYKVEFICKADKKEEFLFNSLYDFLRDHKKTLTYVLFTKIDKSSLHVDLTIDELPLFNEDFDLKMLSKNLNLFFDEIKSDNKSSNRIAAGLSKPDSYRVKIGEIKKTGKTVVFYKNFEGKMEVEK